jgi:phosphohistidine phosphatase
MKTILLIRHAKSSWESNEDDFDRPLNSRGENDAPMMAKRLVKRNIKLDVLISSPAKRAISTAFYFAKAYDIKKTEIIRSGFLYEPTVASFYKAIEHVDDAFESVAVFSHNPAITGFANSLTTVKIDNLPTCSVFAIKANITKWKDFPEGSKSFFFFDFPKQP